MTMATEAGIRGPTACSLLGITYRELDYWARTDIVRPSVKEATGSGTGNQRLYSTHDLVALAVVRDLRAYGLSLESAKTAVAPVRGALVAGIVGPLWLVLGQPIEVTADLVGATRRQDSLFTVLDLTRVIAEITTAVDDRQKTRQSTDEPAD